MMNPIYKLVLDHMNKTETTNFESFETFDLEFSTITFPSDSIVRVLIGDEYEEFFHVREGIVTKCEIV